ncbi:hypothetical protein L1999_20140 [Neobacillus drentensis]|uniref:hypothetical protein n=1 Tax=Neobacillus drentensis TaxID=220684 RepID=UPI001F40D3D8|nr:hypothetical protein [Neobacillus drentensis]ULT55394.1 hypothetical protein L1999_20140 [Neobacillus drentensis]
MAFEKLDSFSKRVSDLADKPSLTPSALKAQFDAAPEELRNSFNALIDALKKTTAGDSGAKNIGVSTVTGVNGTDIQTILASIGTKLGDLTATTGSNENGSYVKLADGTLIQWFNVTFLANDIPWSTVSVAGSTYYFTATTWNFPYSFVTGSIISVHCSGDIPTAGIEQHKAYKPSITSCSVEQGVLGTNPTTLGATTVYKSLLAIGRWK